MEQKNQRNPRRRLNSLILLVAFTAIMLIVSTYAWFSSQKNVTIGNLEGKVNVAEGLMVSLDAKNWTNSLELDATNVVKYLDSGHDLSNPYKTAEEAAGTDGNNNTVPPELIPASATGHEDLNTNKEMTFYRGTNVNGVELYDMTSVDLTEVTATADLDFSGLFAIDLFLQNSGIDLNGANNIAGDADDDVQGTTKETLQLNANSLAKLVSGGSDATGLQNTMRVALANFAHVEDTSAATQEARTSSVHVTATQSQILAAYKDQKITDIAIWEPNAKSHVDYIVNMQSQTPITWNTTVKEMYIADTASNGKFLATEWIPTYALTSASTSASETLKVTGKTGIANIYDWDDSTGTPAGTPAPGVKRQISLQTDKTSATDYTISEDKVRNLVSITSPGANIYEMGNEADVVKFDIYKNEITKLRLYLWLEGQDPDCINYASHGGGVHLDLGLVKGAVAGAVNS